VINETSLKTLVWLQNALRTDDERAQTLIEYGLIIALVSIVAIIALTATGTSIKGIFSSTASKLHS